MTPRLFFRSLLLAGLLLTVAMVGQVVAIVVAPTAVYMTDADPAAAVTLYNGSDRAEEVRVETIFGFPVTTDSGTVELFTDTVGADPRSAADWIQALPRRLVVPPGERRVVRLLARPPADASDGEYWARLVFEARGQELPVGGVDDTTEVSVGLDLQVRTIIAATYRKGDVRTGVSIEDFEPRIESDSLVVRPRFVREGNAAFIGRFEARLIDAGGRTVRSWDANVAVYEDHHRRWAWDVADVAPGSYEVLIRMSTERDDIAPGDRLPAVPVVRTAPVQRR